MIEEAIVHVGMHKTGSSSIQATLHNLASEPDAPAGYLKLNSPNHSGFFMTLLSEKPEEYHAHKLNGRTKEEAKEIQKRFERDLEDALSVFDSRVLIISAEDLSAPSVTENMLGRLKGILSRYCHSLRVVGYVRPPVAYMQSAFQERLKVESSITWMRRNFGRITVIGSRRWIKSLEKRRLILFLSCQTRYIKVM